MLSGLFSEQHLFDTSKTGHLESSSINADFECKLIVNQKVFKVGELPEFKVEIKNLTLLSGLIITFSEIYTS